MEKVKVPNLDTVSTYIDRLTIENVKLAKFELDHESDPKNPTHKDKMNQQEEMIIYIKEKLAYDLTDILKEAKYEYHKEKRTFNI